MKTKALLLSVIAIFALTSIQAGIAPKSEIKNPKTDPATLVQIAFSKISQNYSTTENQINAFYKERVIRNNDCVSVNEAILNINKSPYKGWKRDLVAVKDVRGNCDFSKIDAFMVKLQGGPISALQLDVVKTPFLGTELHDIRDKYNFEYLEPVEMFGRPFYVVAFDQKIKDEETLYKGKIYIDSKSSAIGKIEFSMNVENNTDSYKLFLKSKPKKSTVNMMSADYVVNYREYNGQWYLDYTTSDITFYVEKDKKVPADIYTISSQLAVTSLIAEKFSIDKKDLLKSTDVLADKIGDFKVASEWDIYNLIMLLAINY
ncbi:MAG: hypothetical protein Q8S23_04380 [Bacteroidales bacterium]|nr:hypothetical protein [Bacteroidales bacterium]